MAVVSISSIPAYKRYARKLMVQPSILVQYSRQFVPFSILLMPELIDLINSQIMKSSW